jgi:hypothetical protein
MEAETLVVLVAQVVKVLVTLALEEYLQTELLELPLEALVVAAVLLALNAKQILVVELWAETVAMALLEHTQLLPVLSALAVAVVVVGLAVQLVKQKVMVLARAAVLGAGTKMVVVAAAAARVAQAVEQLSLWLAL